MRDIDNYPNWQNVDFQITNDICETINHLNVVEEENCLCTCAKDRCNEGDCPINVFNSAKSWLNFRTWSAQLIISIVFVAVLLICMLYHFCIRTADYDEDYIDTADYDASHIRVISDNGFESPHTGLLRPATKSSAGLKDYEKQSPKQVLFVDDRSNRFDRVEVINRENEETLRNQLRTRSTDNITQNKKPKPIRAASSSMLQATVSRSGNKLNKI